jgi:large subunit ribosomal protein L12
MEYVYAALLLNDAGKEITEANLVEVVKAAGFTPDESKAKAMVASLKGVNIKEVVKNAQNVQVAAAAAPAQAGHAEHGGAAKPKKEEKADEKKEEEAASGLAGLFG